MKVDSMMVSTIADDMCTNYEKLRNNNIINYTPIDFILYFDYNFFLL